MAWEHFPVSTGDRISAAMLNELRTAAIERGCTVPSALSSGQSLRDAKAFLDSLRSGIEAMVAAYHLVSTGPTFKRFTTGATTGDYKNIFETAFSDTGWRDATISGRITARMLNDIYLVLRKMSYRGYAWNTSGVARTRNSGSYKATCALSMTTCDGASWSAASGTELHYVRKQESFGTYYASQLAGFNVCNISTSLGYATSLHVKMRLTARKHVFGGSESVTDRDLSVDVRKLSSYPTTYAAAVAGTLVGTATAPAGSDVNDVTETILADTSGIEQYYVCPVQTYNASGAGLCSLSGSDAYERVNTTVDSVTGDVICYHGGYTKPGDSMP